MSRLEKELSGELGEFWKNDAESRVARAKHEFETEMTVVDGVVRNRIGRAIMSDMIELLKVAGCQFDVEATQLARDEEVAAACEEYRKNQKPPTEEELYEMRAAFGEGETVVDVISGRKIKL